MKTMFGLFLAAGMAAKLAPLATLAADVHARTNSQAQHSAGVRPAPALHLKFRGTPLDQVLDYFSSAAGFIINQEAEPRGSVDIWNADPVTVEEGLRMLNSALKKNGLAAIRNGRILTIVDAASAKSSDLEVVAGSDPDRVSKSDDIVTQVIPVRYADASQLLANLQPLLPSTASLSANASANSLVLVATRTEIRRALKIVSALDNSLARASSIKVIGLRYADAKQLTAALQQLFSTQAGAQAGNANMGFPGFGPPGGPGGFPGADSSSESTSTTSAIAKVVVVADETSNSLILSAPERTIPGIEDTVKRIDRPVNGITEVRLFRLHNADPAELADQLGQLFPDSSNGSNRDEPMPVFGGGPPGFPAPAEESATSTRASKMGRVISVAEPRTSSLMVSAASALMPQIVKLVEQLDRPSHTRETVNVFELQNATPTEVSQVLKDLFNRNATARNSSATSTLEGNDPLLARQSQQQSSSASGNSGLGNFGQTLGGGATGGGSSGGR